MTTAERRLTLALIASIALAGVILGMNIMKGFQLCHDAGSCPWENVK